MRPIDELRKVDELLRKAGVLVGPPAGVSTLGGVARLVSQARALRIENRLLRQEVEKGKVGGMVR